ncbi:hypothetical protein HHL23_04570 [Chryseobacterium sp. RP-3-3]|uniref:C1q domain-containing protein n=1 Tax=Chryseobacterium antibioticum TaxID=2728847 RepID=A0A7Y0AKQ6_9FLAO|nr:hypothetical protein [Chryseobacterium antibioticum]NML69064.1 hypothetical protein [Chryseobacterium antibioticum]
MKKVLQVLAVLCIEIAYGQLGVNTLTPQATLDVTSSPNKNVPDGIIAPRATGDQIRANDLLYAAPQRGAIVYATAAVTAPSPKTVNITAVGYYYFDGTIWKKFSGSETLTSLTLNVPNSTLDYKDENGSTNTINISPLVKEPWYKQSTTEQATSNTEPIYQMGNVAIGSIAPTAKLDVNGGVRIRNIDDASSIANKTVLLADPNGFVQEIPSTDIVKEPWYKQSTTEQATSNTEPIYQMGNVAIGSIAPTAKLDVNGGVRIRNIDDASSIANKTVLLADPNGFVQEIPSTDIVKEPWYKQSTTEQATSNTEPIYQMGNVAIGSIAPTAKLDVNGGVRIRSMDNVTSIANKTVLLADPNGFVQEIPSTSIVKEPWYKQSTTEQATSNTEPIYQMGPVAIGSMAPTAKLDVNGGVRIRSMDNVTSIANKTVLLADPNGFVQEIPSTSIVKEPWYKQSTTEQATSNTEPIYQMGNVAIGSMAPTAKLDVNGGVRIRSMDNVTSIANKTVLLADPNGFVQEIPSTDIVKEPWYKQSTTEQATSNTEPIYQMGNVAIGSIAPTAKLDVNGGVRIRSIDDIASVNNEKVVMSDSNGFVKEITVDNFLKSVSIPINALNRTQDTDLAPVLQGNLTYNRMKFQTSNIENTVIGNWDNSQNVYFVKKKGVYVITSSIRHHNVSANYPGDNNRGVSIRIALNGVAVYQQEGLRFTNNDSIASGNFTAILNPGDYIYVDSIAAWNTTYQQSRRAYLHITYTSL